MTTEAEKMIQFLEIHVPSDCRDKVKDNLKQDFLFAKTKKKSKRKNRTKKAVFLNRKEREQLNFYNLPHKSFKYIDMLKFNSLWKHYAKEVLGLVDRKPPNVLDKNWESFTQTIYKMDFHGSILKVIQSKCPSYVDKLGICIMDTKETFKIVCENDTVYTLPKKVSIFEVHIDDLRMTFYGSSMCNRPAERSVKKIKSNSLPEF